MTTIPSTTCGAEHDEWRNYANLLAAAHAAHAKEIRVLLQSLPWEGVERVLDAPCGDGFYSALLSECLPPTGVVVAIDNDDEALASLKRRVEGGPHGANIMACKYDVFDMPFEVGSFDFIWCAQSLISLTNPKEVPPRGPGIKSALDEFHRALKPDGRIALLEQDAMHYVLLPWPAELELAIHQAHRKGFARKYGQPEQLDFGRQLGRILVEGGFQLEQRFSLTADRHGIPKHADKTFLQAYFTELRGRVHRDLSPENLQMFDQWTDPECEASFFHDPGFEMTWIEFVALARKP